jgi:hypothetical protein|tara:strand:+ start:44 stop:499 length:456 start_codon:yes stop_codon:yes gene_type:complete
MARTDDYAFNAMNAGDPDMDAITGGAITYSEFEMDMTPKQQEKYRKTLMNTLDTAYRSDPNKGRLGFSDWLDNLRPDLVMERAKKWEEVRRDKDVMNEMDPKEFSVLEDSGLLQSLLMKHTGRLEDVRDVIGADVPRPIEEFKVSEREYRR